MSTMDTHPGFSPACSVYTQWLLVSHLPKCGPDFMGSVWWQQALTERPMEPESFCLDSPVCCREPVGLALCEGNHCSSGEVGTKGMGSPKRTGFATGASVFLNFMQCRGGVRQELEDRQSQACPSCPGLLQLDSSGLRYCLEALGELK